VTVLRELLEFAQDHHLGVSIALLLLPVVAHRPYPLVPMARTKLYRNLSPTASGPLIDAVAKSGY